MMTLRAFPPKICPFRGDPAYSETMAHLLDALKRVLSLLLRVLGGVVEQAKPAVKKVVRAAVSGLRRATAAILGEEAEKAGRSLKLLLTLTTRVAASEHAPEPGKARRLFQLIGWRLHGGGSRGEAHVKAA